MSKLNNLHQIEQMLVGEHKTQTKKSFSFHQTEHQKLSSISRKVGDVWEEKDPEGNVVAIWEQKQGYRMKHPSYWSKELAELQYNQQYVYSNCLHTDTCKSIPKDRLDAKFKLKFDRCANCQFEFETKMKLNGTYKEYEKKKMIANAEAFFKDADAEVDIVVNQLEETQRFSTIKADGTPIHWTDSSNIKDNLKTAYNAYKEGVIEKLNNLHEQTEQTEPADSGAI